MDASTGVGTRSSSSTGIVQFLLETVLLQTTAVSEISKNRCEIEQKYLLASIDLESAFATREEELKRFFSGRGICVTPFDGTDYIFVACKGDAKKYFRFRTGFPVSYRMGVKVKRSADGVVRCEIEFPVGSDAKLENVLAYHREFISLADSWSEHRINVRGLIRHVCISPGSKEQMEIVLCIGTNLDTGKSVFVSEIEAHNFDDESTAREWIRKYEVALGWESFRTGLSMTQLLS